MRFKKGLRRRTLHTGKISDGYSRDILTPRSGALQGFDRFYKRQNLSNKVTPNDPLKPSNRFLVSSPRDDAHFQLRQLTNNPTCKIGQTCPIIGKAVRGPRGRGGM